jgi:transcriptional regulator with XRE-family HTH domain
VPKTKKYEPRLTGAQLRAARALLDITAEELAAETKLSLKTIRRAEQGHGPVEIHTANAERAMSVLEERGVQFIAANGEGVGVRLRREPPPRFGAAKERSKT